jgi:hypothetical protein
MKNCVVRSYSRKYTNPMSDLIIKLNNGWIVKNSIPFINSKGETDYIEYILERIK